jgi:hypothetical protein
MCALQVLRREALDELVDGLGFAVGAQPCSRPSGLAGTLGQTEHRVRGEHARDVVDREHVLGTGVVEFLAKLDGKCASAWSFRSRIASCSKDGRSRFT